MFDNLTFPWQIFNAYSGRQRNSLIYKYYIEIQTLRIFTWQFSIERVSISATVESTRYGLSTVTCPVYINTLLAYMIKYICIKMFWYLQTFLTIMAAMLKLMFIYNQFMMLDDKSFWKCVCGVFAATLTKSKINWGFVFLCIRSKDFCPHFYDFRLYTLSCSTSASSQAKGYDPL
jgi:hypothetical protein